MKAITSDSQHYLIYTYFLQALNKIALIVPLSVNHFIYKKHLINTALRNGGLVISNDSFTDVYDTMSVSKNIVVSFSIDYIPMKPEYFTFAFQVGIQVVFHLDGRKFFSFLYQRDYLKIFLFFRGLAFVL